MKVTALIPDDLVHEVDELAHGKNLTESLVIALKEWSSIRKMKNIEERILKKPVFFRKGFSARNVRELNRRS